MKNLIFTICALLIFAFSAQAQRQVPTSDGLRIRPLTAPPSPIRGEFYFDDASGTLGMWDGSQWVFYKPINLLSTDDIDDAGATNKFVTQALIDKVTGIEEGATADMTDPEIETAYNNQVPIVSQVDAEEGTSTTPYRWTPQRILQAVVALAPAALDEQTLSLVDNTLSIENGNGVDLSSYLDNTDEQDLSLTANILSLTGDPGGDVDLSPYLDNTDNQTAAEVPITDTGDYYTDTTVEGALQENGATDVSQGASISQNGSDISDIQNALSTVPSSQMGSVTYTANQSSIASHAIDSLIVVLDYDDETYTIESGVFSHGQSIRIRNGASGMANIVAGTGVTFPSTSLYTEGQAITVRRLTTATGPEIWGIDDGVPSAQIFVHEEALSDYTTNLSTGTSLGYWRTPSAIEILEVRASLIDPSSSGLVTVDINASGTTIMTTNKLSIDATEETSETAATAAALTTTTLGDDVKVTYDIDASGTDAMGLKVKIYYVKL